MKVRPALFILENDKALLMQYRYGETDVYNLPGGNPDPTETLVQTLVREMEEEMGITVTVGKLILIGEVLMQDSSKEDVLHCVFEGKILEGIPVLNPAQTSAKAIVWKAIDEIYPLAMYPQVGEQLQNILSQKSDNQYIGKINQVWY
jgi:8-oxo-dGTP diphosphatase